MALSGDHVVNVSEVPSERWELALEQIATGGAMTVIDGEPPVGIQRYAGWPGADGHVHISIFTALEPSVLTPEIASRDVKAGLGLIDRLLDADPRLGHVLDQFGLVRSYVCDYGNGAVAVGDVSDDGTVQLH